MTTLNDQFNELVKVTLAEKKVLTENDKDMSNVQMEVMGESGKSPDFFQGNKPSTNKPSRNYRTSRVKSRKILSNVLYIGINKEGFCNENFVSDVYSFVTKILNPFSLDRKLNDQNKHQMIYMLWKECMPQKCYQHVCKKVTFFT